VKNESYSTFSFVSIEFVLHPSDFVGSSKKLLRMIDRRDRLPHLPCFVRYDRSIGGLASLRTSGHGWGKAGLARTGRAFCSVQNWTPGSPG
jgi:hypothetical protein